MKKKLFVLVLLIGVCVPFVGAQRQPKFGKYFEDQTLRMDYYRVGNRKADTVELCRYVKKHGGWAGSQTVMLDPFDNGDYRVVMVDAASGVEIYSRGYNTLFREYRDTKAGEDSVARLEEVVLMPWPKAAVYIRMEKRDERMRMQPQVTLLFDPRTTEVTTLPTGDSTRAAMKLRYEGNSHRKMDVVIVPEGYGPKDKGKMRRDMYKFADYTLAQEPFKGRAKDFNLWTLPCVGEESGITNPGKGLRVNSAVGATYYTFGSDRYLMTFNLFKLHDVLDEVPYDHIIIMANSDTYGGGAIYNFYAVSAVQEMSMYILPHELGHSIGGLADEYVDEDLSYGDMHKAEAEPVEPNITNLVDFGSKWADMLPEGTAVPTPENLQVSRRENGPLGVYEGAGYKPKGVYRPVMHCMMRDYAPFCPVCSKRLNEVFDLYCK